MNSINFNRAIRKNFNEFNERFKEQNNGQSITDTELSINSIVGISFDEQGRRFSHMYNSMIMATGYSDMMTFLILKKKTMGLTEEEEYFFELLNNISTFNELFLLYNTIPEFYSIAINEMLGFYNSDVYHKILCMKCLDEEEIIKISKINTIFNQYLQIYNIDVDLNYIINKIYNSIGKVKNEEDLLNDATAFITIMARIDKKTAKKIIIQMIQNDIKIINCTQKTNIKYPTYKSTKLERLYKYKNIILDNILNEFDFEEVRFLLFISLQYIEFKKEIDQMDLNKENNKIIEEIKKYEMEMN